MPLALAWRARRGSGKTPKAAFKELCAYLDKCNAEDRAAGRPSMVEHLEKVFALSGVFRWNDR